MKVDLIITELEVGGAERCCFELAKFLSLRGHRVRIVSIGPLAVPPKDEILRQAQQHNIPVVSLNAAKATQLPLAWWRLRQLLRRDKPDIVQSFMWHANVLAAGVYPSFGIPLLTGNRVLEPRRSRHMAGRWAANRAERVICVSREVANWAHQFERVPESKLEVIPNGIDLETWDRKAEDGSLDPLPSQLAESKSPVLLFVGRFGKQKGVDIIAARMNDILAKLPSHHLVLIGWGPDRPHLEAAQEASPSSDRIHILGQRDDISPWMHRSDLLILPTRYEGMPNVILEAMASRLPVATMQVEGVADLLGDTLNEQAVPRDDWDAWQNLAIELAKDPEKLRSLGERNRQRVEEHFQIDGILQQYETRYQNILEDKQRQ